MKLLESIIFYEVIAVIKSNADYNKLDIFNKIRGIKDIVTVKVLKSEQLEKLSKDGVEFNLLKVKFITSTDPLEKLEKIKDQILHSKITTDKIVGVLNIAFKTDDLKKIDKL